MSPSPAPPPGPGGAATATVAELLAQARAAGVERLDAQLLLAQATARSRTWVIAHADAPLDAASAQAFTQACRARANQVPLAYLLGEREFYGLSLQVTPDVLVPRPDTELLVDWALSLLLPRASTVGALRVLDLGTGSGAIALAIRQHCPAAQVWASDASAAALAVAHGNAQRLGLPLNGLYGDWFAALASPQGMAAAPTPTQFDLIVSNPPYIDAGDSHLAALHAEPLAALTPGPDGLAALRQIISGAPEHLAPGAWLLLEHGYDQALAVRRLLTAAGFQAAQTRQDLGGQDRCSGGWWPDSRCNSAKGP